MKTYGGKSKDPDAKRDSKQKRDTGDKGKSDSKFDKKRK